jgi:hypothetical protein
MRLRRFWLGLAAVLTAGTVAMSLPPDSYASAVQVGAACTVAELPRVDGAGQQAVLFVDRTGAYQVGAQFSWDGGGTYREFLLVWQGGTVRRGPELDTVNADLTAVNSAGVIVGSEQPAGQHHAIVLTYGQFVRLAEPSGADTNAVAINDAGQVTGGVLDGSGRMQHVLRWSADGTVSELPTPAGYAYAQAMDIDADGSVLGLVTNDPAMYSDAHLVVWAPNGQAHILPGTDPDAHFWPIGIRQGTVTGTEYSSTGSVVLRWTASGGAPVTVDSADAASILAVNARRSLLIQGSPSYDGTGLLRDGVLRPLPGAGQAITTVGLSDNDVVYGNSNGVAVLADCRS